MTPNQLRLIAVGLLASMFLPSRPLSAAVPPLTTVRVASGLSRPVYVAAPPGDQGRLFIVEQRGSAGVGNRADIRVLNLAADPPALLPTPFLTITGVSTGGEQGLLGLAFDPNYLTNGRFYLNYTNAAGTTIIERRIDANPLDNVHTNASGSPNTVISIAQPFSNHNAGWLGFSPVDGYLYIPLGDGGSSCDPGGRAQNINELLGKTLRLDVSGATGYAVPPTNPFAGATPGLDEIWNLGLRNPFRCSFDRATGDLYLGDVGQAVYEEIDFENPGAGGRNYGWDIREGFACSTVSGCPSSCATGFTDPAHAYDQTVGARCAVTGGYVYRGCRMPGLQGQYFFADYCSNEIWSMPAGGGAVTARTTELAPGGGLSIASISSFGEDAQGEIYLCDLSGGEVFKIVPKGVGDLNGDGAVNLLDVSPFVLALVNPAGYAAAYPALDGYIRANINGDCAADGRDVDAMVNLLLP
jgi:glucose/arabinose dehydrogenase